MSVCEKVPAVGLSDMYCSLNSCSRSLLVFLGVCEGWKALCSMLAAENQVTGNNPFKLPVQA